MRNFIIITATALAVVFPVFGTSTAKAQHGHGGGGGHGGGFHGNQHHGGGHWRNGIWIPFVVGGAIVGTECWRWVIDEWGYRRRIWVC